MSMAKQKSELELLEEKVNLRFPKLLNGEEVKNFLERAQGASLLPGYGPPLQPHYTAKTRTEHNGESKNEYIEAISGRIRGVDFHCYHYNYGLTNVPPFPEKPFRGIRFSVDATVSKVEDLNPEAVEMMDQMRKFANECIPKDYLEDLRNKGNTWR